MNLKEIHTFSLFIKKEKLPLLPNLTQFYIPGNPNLKMNLYRKLHFLKNKDPCPHHRAQGTTRTKKNKKWEIRTTNMFYLGHQDNIQILNNFFLGLECFYKHSNSKMSNQKTKYILFLLLGILNCTEMGNETAGYYWINFGTITFGKS